MRPDRRHRSPDLDEEADDEEDELPAAPRRARRRAGSGVREWSAESEDDAAEEDDEERGLRRLVHHRKEPVYFRARDSVYFEPLVALAVIVVLLVSLFAYTGNWPPMYVVESDSMQHGYVDRVGLINTGDLVLAQKTSPSAIQPYVVAMQDGYTTYGEYGDVILYLPNGLTDGTPIIHRALVYLEANPNGSFNAPGLANLACGYGPGAVYTTSNPGGCGTQDLSGLLTLHHIGWRSVNVQIDLAVVGDASGYVTMGDNNFNTSNTSWGLPDEPTLTNLVQPAWIVGAARGMIPWFGSLKLLLEGNSQMVPPQSWEFMGVTVVGLVLAAMLFHFLLRAEGIEDERRKRAEEEEAGDDDEDDGAEEGSWFRSFRRRGREDSEDEEEEAPPRSRGRRAAPESRRGRPKPVVGRRPPSRRHRDRRAGRDDDD